MSSIQDKLESAKKIIKVRLCRKGTGERGWGGGVGFGVMSAGEERSK